ncbi:DUF4180 domain-containing protein [Rhodobacterales bacterium HKCCE2091]|nr:DUF4180 domain-containing protein [Rhodobacterales bacterium HKCCE2091]
MISTGRDIQDLIAESFADTGRKLVRDTSDFSAEFWDLRTGLLGELAQKLVNYGAELTLTGDLTAEIAASRALRDFFRESARTGPIHLETPPDLL